MRKFSMKKLYAVITFNEKQLRVKIDTGTNKVTNVSTAVTQNAWY